MVRRSGFIPLIGPVLLLSSLVASHATPAQDPAPPKPGVEAQPPQKQTKNPLAKLAEPWPDAERMRERRTEAEHRRLFESADPLTFTLSADFKAVNKDRDPTSTKRFPAVLSIVGEGGKTESFPVKLGTRGNFRLMARNCTFVPLRVEFPKQEVKGTVFDGQEALKLVTHCRANRAYEQYTLSEYIVYKIFNLFTPRSFRARLSKATYVDSTTGKTITTRRAMFIEDDDDVARRMDGRIAELPRVLFRDLDQESLTLLMLLQYMIANTDFSIYALHNVRLVQNQARVLYPVTYDFDLSGLVNTGYASPNRALRIKTVRDRLYRGPCRSVEELEPFLATFRAKKNEVMALYDSLGDLDVSYRQEAKAYLEEFYSTINRKGDVKREFVDKCSKQPGM